MLMNALLAVTIVSAFAAHIGAGWGRSWRQVAALAVLDLLLVVLVLVSGDDERWSAWMREDAFAEWSTTYAFLAAGAVFAWRALRGRGWSRLTAVGLALFCFFVAGEEVSWGQRILAFQPPEIFLEQNFQQEANLHNLLTDKELAGYSLDSRFLVALICVLYGILGAALRLLPSRWTWAADLAPPGVLVPAWAVVAMVELDYPVHLAGEAAEWMLGLTFLLDALLRQGRPAAPSAWAWLLVPASVALGAASAPAMDALIYGSDEAGVATAQAELDQLAADLSTARLPRLSRKGRVHKRVYTTIESGYLAFGTSSSFLEGQASPAEAGDGPARSDRKGYFLDPWTNPYWILWDRDDQTLVLYSFGPNRRRDIDSKPFGGQAGDDVVVVVP